jgi:putative ATP-dependent endonuclease of the OLD family
VCESLADDPEPALRRRISHVYLPPLRDAVRDLDGADQAELHGVLRLLIGDDEDIEADFLQTANDALQAMASHKLATTARDEIQAVFSRTTPPNREHALELNKRELELRRLVRLLRLQLAEGDTALGDIASTGLGYANLLYMAMIVLQLANAKDSDLTLLLVEEPEAHLHPQLQLVLLEFLQNEAQKTTPDDADDLKPSGKVQVIVTTHSPILASTVSLTNVVVVARQNEDQQWCSKATVLSELGLSATDIRKVDRYLNSTRAALLFARDVILVEGVAENLMLPALAQRHLRTLADQLIAPPAKADELAESPAGLPVEAKAPPMAATTPASPVAIPPAGTPTSGAEIKASSVISGAPATATTPPPPDAEQRRRAWLRQFASATIISVEGVDFEPYLHVLLDGEHPRVDRVVVITDRDHTGAGDTRKTHYEGVFARAVAEGRFSVEVGGTTLEAELFRAASNEQVLKDAFLTLHPKSTHHWENVAAEQPDDTPDSRAARFAEAIRADSSATYYIDISKGDFAHLVAEAIRGEAGTPFVVPEYLGRAIASVARVDESAK